MDDTPAQEAIQVMIDGGERLCDYAMGKWLGGAGPGGARPGKAWQGLARQGLDMKQETTMNNWQPLPEPPGGEG